MISYIVIGMNATTALSCDCASMVPLTVVTICLSFSALLASFFTHSKLVHLSTMLGQREYGKIGITSL